MQLATDEATDEWMFGVVRTVTHVCLGESPTHYASFGCSVKVDTTIEPELLLELWQNDGWPVDNMEGTCKPYRAHDQPHFDKSELLILCCISHARSELSPGCQRGALPLRGV